jgi:hypothetical protein
MNSIEAVSDERAWLVTAGPDGESSTVVIGFEAMKQAVVRCMWPDPSEEQEANDMLAELSDPDFWEGDYWRCGWSFEDGYLHVQRITDLPQALRSPIQGEVKDEMIERGAVAIDALWSADGTLRDYPFPETEDSYQEHCRSTARAALSAALSSPAPEPDALRSAPTADDPAIAYQEAEKRLCECGAAGSGEGHSDFCPWLDSAWKKWGDAVDASPAPMAERDPRDRAIRNLQLFINTNAKYLPNEKQAQIGDFYKRLGLSLNILRSSPQEQTISDDLMQRAKKGMAAMVRRGLLTAPLELTPEVVRAFSEEAAPIEVSDREPVAYIDAKGQLLMTEHGAAWFSNFLDGHKDSPAGNPAVAVYAEPRKQGEGAVG